MPNDKPKRPGLAYYQAASLCLLLIITGFSIAGLWGVASIVSPALTITSFEWRGLHTRGNYLKAGFNRRRCHIQQFGVDVPADCRQIVAGILGSSILQLQFESKFHAATSPCHSRASKLRTRSWMRRSCVRNNSWRS